jgi:hypothetical protein
MPIFMGVCIEEMRTGPEISNPFNAVGLNLDLS